MAKCSRCGEEVTHVRETYTGATFPVDAEALVVQGFELQPPKEGERNQRAVRKSVALHAPHDPFCSQREEATDGDPE